MLQRYESDGCGSLCQGQPWEVPRATAYLVTPWALPVKLRGSSKKRAVELDCRAFDTAYQIGLHQLAEESGAATSEGRELPGTSGDSAAPVTPVKREEAGSARAASEGAAARAAGALCLVCGDGLANRRLVEVEAADGAKMRVVHKGCARGVPR